jgi:hypothetical protein
MTDRRVSGVGKLAVTRADTPGMGHIDGDLINVISGNPL